MARRSAASCSRGERRLGRRELRRVRQRTIRAARGRAAPVYSRSAASPRSRTSATMRPGALEQARGLALRRDARRTAARCASSSVVQSRMASAAVMAASSPPAAPAARWRRRPSGSRGSPRTRSRGRPRAPPPCRPWPSSGITVGDSLPGSSCAICGSAERGACSMMYLLSRTCCTPSMRSSSRRTQSAFSSGSGTGVRISAASLSSTVVTSRRWLATAGWSRSRRGRRSGRRGRAAARSRPRPTA